MRNILIKTLSMLLLLSVWLYAVVGPHGTIEGKAYGSYHNNKDCVYCHTPDYNAEATAGTTSDSKLDGGSMTCMSCHDGISAINMAIGGSNIGNSLADNHPVSVEYVEGVAGLRLKTDIVEGIRDVNTVNDLLVNGKVECISCHNPHGAKDINGNPLRLYLRSANIGSALCYACHDK